MSSILEGPKNMVGVLLALPKNAAQRVYDYVSPILDPKHRLYVHPTFPRGGALPKLALDNTRSLIIKMGEALTTTQPTCIVTLADVSDESLLEDEFEASFNSTTEVTAVAPPNNSARRLIGGIIVCNIDTVAHTIYISVAVGAARYYLVNGLSLAVNGTLVVDQSGVTSIVVPPSSNSNQVNGNPLYILSSSDSVQMKLGGAGTDTYCHISYVDIQGTTITPGSAHIASTGATLVTVLAGPAAGVTRHIQSIIVCNANAGSQNVTLNILNTAVNYPILNTAPFASGATTVIK